MKDWDKEFEEIRQRTYEAMANPKPDCEKCNKELKQFNRIWDGNRWVCYHCHEENQQ